MRANESNICGKMLSLEILTVLILTNVGARAFIYGNKPVDCLFTNWSEWSSEPIVAGATVRTRSVLRYPANGGMDCPSELLETQNTDTEITVEETARIYTKSFLFNHATNSRQRRQTGIGYRRDLLVILDASGSITSPNFAKATDQIPRLLQTLCPEPNPFDNIHKLSVISYSDYVYPDVYFNSFTTTKQVLSALRGISYSSQCCGNTNTAAAFMYAKTMFENSKGARMNDPNVKQEVLILTDGFSNDPTAAIAAAKELQKTAEVFALIIGTKDQAGRDEILQYVSQPLANHIFSLKNVDDLAHLVAAVEANVKTMKCMPFDLT